MSQQINLYNPIFRKRGFSFTSATGMVYGVGIAVALTMAVGVYENYKLRDVQRQAAVVDQALKDATALQEKLAAELKTKKPDGRFEAELAALDVQLKGREEIFEILKSGAVGSTTGFSEYMRAFSRQSIPGLWLTGFDIALSGNELAIEGRTLRAELVATYLTQLNQEKVLQGRQFAALRISQPRADPAAAQATAAQGNVRAPDTPRYLDFNISTIEPVEGTRQGARAAAVQAPLLGAIDSTGPGTSRAGSPARATP